MVCFLMSKIIYVNGKKTQADTGQGTGGFIIEQFIVAYFL